MHDLPHGTVTFLFTDIESSTRLWNAHPDTMPAAYSRHDAILRGAFAARGGSVYKTIGDAFQVAFPTAADAVDAAIDAQRTLQSEPWPMPEPLKVRMALHTGAVDPDSSGDYRSPVLNRLGRLLSAGHGGQALVSQATMELARDSLTKGASLIDLGKQRLKDLYRPEHVFQVAAEGLATDFPRLRTLDSRPNNLPTQLTQLIGRQDDVAAVCNLLRRDNVRLVTLTGPGGMGKTRLALQVAADLLDAFADGVYLVRLDTLTDPELVPAAIANVFGLREDTDTELFSIIERYLRDRQLLLVLDNLEQVIDASTGIRDLLIACPGLKVLATSRVRMQVSGEREYAVHPLDLPATGADIDAEALSQYDSVRLFIERAEAVKADFEVNRANAPAIAGICARLDGLPLAIELAAARVKILPPEALLRRLQTRLPLLTGGSRDLPLRQQTLRGAIAWSYELLSPEDRALFRRLTVFAGGANLEAIERVAFGDGPAWDALDILEGLERLVNQSLVRQTEVAGEPRFSMFETIREFGQDELRQHGEDEEAHRTHAQVMTDLLATYRLDFAVSELGAWLDRVETEHDNVRVALGWALDHDPAMANRIAGFGGRYWMWRNQFREGRAWLERALELDPSDVSKEDRARALWNVAVFLQEGDDWEEARRSVEQSIRLYDEIGHRGMVAAGWSMLSMFYQRDGELDRAITQSEAAVALAREVSDRFFLLWCLNNFAYFASTQGLNDVARVAVQEALEISRECDDVIGMTLWLTAGDIYRIDGEYEQADRFYLASLRDAWEHGLTSVAISALMGMVMTAVASSRWERAARLAGMEAALRQVRDIAVDPDAALSLSEYDEHLGRLGAEMDREAVRSAWDAGASTPVGDLVAELLVELDADDPSFPYLSIRQGG